MVRKSLKIEKIIFKIEIFFFVKNNYKLIKMFEIFNFFNHSLLLTIVVK